MLITPLDKTKAFVSLIQKEFPNYHPLVSIARIAHDEDADLKLQFECHKVIAKYIEPELKSVEVKAEVTESRKLTVSMFDYEEVSFKETPTLSNW